MAAFFTVLDPGLLSTVQDAGRFGYQALGITPAGAADAFSFRAANMLVGNPLNAAALEFTYAGPVLQTSHNCLVAVTGAELPPRLNGVPRPSGMALFVRGGTVVDFWRPPGARGVRAYLAVAGGFSVPEVLGSRSTDLRARLGGLEGRPLQTGDRLPVGEPPRHWRERAGRGLAVGWDTHLFSSVPLRVIPGPHFAFFEAGALDLFFAASYQVAPESDRMGLRLRGPAVVRREGEILSFGLVSGAIQVPPDGQPIVLLADLQTTGGYPLLGCVIRADAPRLAQKGESETVRFAPVSLSDARDAYRSLVANIISN